MCTLQNQKLESWTQWRRQKTIKLDLDENKTIPGYIMDTDKEDMSFNKLPDWLYTTQNKKYG